MYANSIQLEDIMKKKILILKSNKKFKYLEVNV